MVKLLINRPVMCGRRADRTEEEQGDDEAFEETLKRMLSHDEKL
jgi:hypothetical protein